GVQRATSSRRRSPSRRRSLARSRPRTRCSTSCSSGPRRTPSPRGGASATRTACSRSSRAWAPASTSRSARSTMPSSSATRRSRAASPSCSPGTSRAGTLSGTCAPSARPRAPSSSASRLRWLPLLAAPLVACQAYSTAGTVDLSVFFWTLRKKAADEPGASSGALDLAYPYAALCILSASAANVRTPAYYASLCLLAAWALWSRRSHRFSSLWWGTSLAVAVVAGYAGHLALHRVQQKLEEVAFEYISGLVRRDTDPFRSTTAIGHLGRLKLSDRILLRVEPAAGQGAPILLREASYNVYKSPAWFALGAGFTPVQPEAGGETW